MKRIYLAGPISLGGSLSESEVNANLQAFHRADQQLRAHGYDVANPATNLTPDDPTWENWMRLALGKMLTCDEVCLLPGWELSRGATIEYNVARELGMRTRNLADYLADRHAFLTVETTPA